MNSIDIRVFDKETKVLRELAGFKHSKCKDSYSIWFIGKDGEVMYCEPNKRDIEFSRYTGMNDRNGTSIYEGDIVRHYNMPQFPDVYKVAVVIYEEERASFRKRNVGEDRTFGFGKGCNYEVIGNIYENTELLD